MTNKLSPLLLLVVLLTGCNTYKYAFETVNTDGNTTLRDLNEGLASDRFYVDGNLNNVTVLRFYTLPEQMASAVAPGMAESSFATSVFFLNKFPGNDLSVLQLSDGVGNGISTGGAYDWTFSLQLASADESSDPSTYNFFKRLTQTVKDVGIDADGILAWGRWTDPTLYVHTGFSSDCCSDTKSLHYVFGTATPNADIPSSGTAVFNLVGATAPTIDSGALPAGTLNASSTVGVVWGGAASTQVGVDLSGQIGGLGFVVQTPGGSANPALSDVVYNSTTRSFSGATLDDATFSGFFAGKNASHVGLTYSVPVSGVVDGNPVSGTVQGAAAFSR